jgi:hypothetical protein
LTATNEALNGLLQASDSVRNVEDAWFFMHTLFELIWQYRFLYRDLNDLLSKNRRLETHFQWVLHRNKTRSCTPCWKACSGQALLHRHANPCEATATSMVVVLTYWLSYEYVRDPRHALEPESAHHALLRGAHHVLNLLVPYLEATQRMHLLPWRRPMPHRRADSPPHDQQQHDGDTHGTLDPLPPRRRLRLGCHPCAATMEPAAPGRRGAPAPGPRRAARLGAVP